MTVNDLLNQLKDKDPDMPIEQALSLTAKMDIYEIYQRECDEEDCVGYLTEHGYEASAKDKDFIDGFVTRYRHKFDCEFGTWDNIEATIDYFQDELDKYGSTAGSGADSGEM